MALEKDREIYEAVLQPLVPKYRAQTFKSKRPTSTQVHEEQPAQAKKPKIRLGTLINILCILAFSSGTLMKFLFLLSSELTFSHF